MTILDQRFLTLLRSGLWGTQPDESLFSSFHDEEERLHQWKQIFRMSSIQTVTGTVADGIDHLPSSVQPPVKVAQAFAAAALQTESRNRQIDAFIPEVYLPLIENGIETVLVKGQGVARYYIDPSRRQSGDIDLLIMRGDYQKARDILCAKADRIVDDSPIISHLGLLFGTVEVELHGTPDNLLSRSIDAHMREMQAEMFRKKDFRDCDISGTHIQIPSADFDALYIMIHFLHHFYHSGVGLRQICDWSRVLYMCGSSIDRDHLLHELKKMDLLVPWKAFGRFSSDYLGCPVEAVPFVGGPQEGRSEKIWRFIMKSGNFGHQIEKPSRESRTVLGRKLNTFMSIFPDLSRHFTIFPAQTAGYCWDYLSSGISRLFKR